MTTATAPPPEEDLTAEAAAAAVAAILVSQATRPDLAYWITVKLIALGAAPAAAVHVAQLAGHPVPAPGAGTAQARVWRLNTLHRARYLLAAARRLTTGPGPSGEARHWRAHQAAVRWRAAAARQVDQAARQGGGLMRWQAVLDARTTADCRKLNGRRFTIDNPPRAGYPGTLHARCRCRAVPVRTLAELSQPEGETIMNTPLPTNLDATTNPNSSYGDDLHDSASNHDQDVINYWRKEYPSQFEAAIPQALAPTDRRAVVIADGGEYHPAVGAWVGSARDAAEVDTLPGETDLDRRQRIAMTDNRDQARAAARAYARTHGLI